MPTAREEVASFKGQLDETLLTTAEELLRSIQAMGSRRHQSGWRWAEPEVIEVGGTLLLQWKKLVRTLSVAAHPGRSDQVTLVFETEDVPLRQPSWRGLGEAAGEVVQFLSDGVD